MYFNFNATFCLQILREKNAVRRLIDLKNLSRLKDEKRATVIVVFMFSHSDLWSLLGLLNYVTTKGAIGANQNYSLRK